MVVTILANCKLFWKPILEALLFIPFLSHPPPAITIYTDSTYARDLLLGLALPSSNHDLVHLLLERLSEVATRIPIAIVKVKGHSGQEGNDRADSLAARGVHSSSFLGRYSSFPPTSPPSLPNPLLTWFTSSLWISKQNTWSHPYREQPLLHSQENQLSSANLTFLLPLMRRLQHSTL